MGGHKKKENWGEYALKSHSTQQIRHRSVQFVLAQLSANSGVLRSGLGPSPKCWLHDGGSGIGKSWLCRCAG